MLTHQNIKELKIVYQSSTLVNDKILAMLLLIVTFYFPIVSFNFLLIVDLLINVLLLVNNNNPPPHTHTIIAYRLAVAQSSG